MCHDITVLPQPASARSLVRSPRLGEERVPAPGQSVRAGFRHSRFGPGGTFVPWPARDTAAFTEACGVPCCG